MMVLLIIKTGVSTSNYFLNFVVSDNNNTKWRNKIDDWTPLNDLMSVICSVGIPVIINVNRCSHATEV